MKQLVLLGSLLLVTVLSSAQTTHTLTGTDHYFSPDTLYIEVGDSIELVNIGYHSATEVDSIDWVNNTPTHNGGFYVGFGAPTSDLTFSIDAEGTYYNICVPHAGMAMKSIIIVESIGTSINGVVAEQEGFIYPNPATNSITVQHSSTIKIYSMAGQVVFEKTGLAPAEEVGISFLTPGAYFVVLDGQQQKLIVR